MAKTVNSGGSIQLSLKNCISSTDTTPEIIQEENSITVAHSMNSEKEGGFKELKISEILPLEVSTFRCERCEIFQTNSRATLLLHVVECLSSNASESKVSPSDEQLYVTTVLSMGQDNSNGIVNLSVDSQPSKIVPSITTAADNDSTENSSASTSLLAARKVFECDVCKMKFSNGANMRRHKMRHTGVKPYECRVCQKRFFRKDHLAEHFTTHTKSLPYHCPICNRGFQRQIAMRAHFQNEHVGQHELVKTCPLCSYRAGSMKSLRIHFFNRHGIDLDNPETSGTSSLLLALESRASEAVAGASPLTFPDMTNKSDIEERNRSIHRNSASLRSVENTTPPMHFLTPQVEIATLPENGADVFNVTSSFVVDSQDKSALSCVLRAFPLQENSGNNIIETEFNHTTKEINDLNNSLKLHQCEQPNDTDGNILSSSSSYSLQPGISVKNNLHDSQNHITPSISLIPIKQEPNNEDPNNDNQSNVTKKSNLKIIYKNGEDSESKSSSMNHLVTSMIKVSPLKSLLREDLKKRICDKVNNRISRSAAILQNNSIFQSDTAQQNAFSNSVQICNGVITSSGLESDIQTQSRKQILTCLFCNIEFPDETLYFLHKGCHSESNPWKCNICGEQCNNVYEFNSHLLSKSHQ